MYFYRERWEQHFEISIVIEVFRFLLDRVLRKSVHILEWGKNSVAYWMPFLFMHLLFQAHKKHVNLQLLK